MRKAIAAAIFSLFATPAFAAPPITEHELGVRMFFHVSTMAYIAAQYCPNVVRNDKNITILKNLTGLTKDDFANHRGEREYAITTKAFEAADAGIWCIEAQALIGPDGALFKGLIDRP